MNVSAAEPVATCESIWTSRITWLYPLVPSGSRLKADLHCPGFNAEKGKTYREFLESQGVLTYVQRHLER